MKFFKKGDGFLISLQKYVKFSEDSESVLKNVKWPWEPIIISIFG
jgi:hypothetical protein